MNGLFTNSVFLATSFPGSPSVETGRREPWERGCVFGRGGEGVGGFHCSNGVRSFATLGTRVKLGRVDFRKDFWDCY